MSKFSGAVYGRVLEPRLLPVLLAFCQHVNAKGATLGDTRVWVSVDTVGWMVGLNYRTVQRHVRALEALGVMVEVDPVEHLDYRPGTTYAIDLKALSEKPPREARVRKKKSTKGVARDALQAPAKGVNPSDEGRHPVHGRASGGANKGVTALTPKVVRELEGKVVKEVGAPNDNGLTPPPKEEFDKEAFFARKGAEARAELEARARRGDVWAAGILDGLDRRVPA